MPIKPVARLWSFLTSKKLAVVLIILLTLVSIVGMLVPQAAALNRVFSSWWFLLISFLFLINLFACTCEQVTKAWRIWKKRKAELPAGSLQDKVIINVTGEVLEKACLQQGFKVVNKEVGISVLSKGSLGIWSSSLVHLGLIIVVLGGLISAGFKMVGYMTVMEGEIRREAGAEYEYLSAASFFNVFGHTGYGIGLDRQQRILDKTGRVEYTVSEITLYKGDRPVIKKPVESGKPLIYNGLSLNEYNAGFAPLVTITGSGDREIYKGFLFMDTVPGSPDTSYQRKNFTVPGTAFELNTRFYPDMVIKDDKIAIRKFALGNPGMEISITQKGKEIAKGVVTKGEKLSFAGNKLYFDEVKHWAGLEIVIDPGANILFAGLGIVVIGMLFLYLWNYRKLQVRFAPGPMGNNLEISLYCLKNKVMFIEEINILIKSLENVDNP